MADLATTVSRWRDSASVAQGRYTEGVQQTQVDVVGRAISAQPKLKAGFNQAVDSGRRARNLADVGTAGWKQATVAKASNYATGIAAGADKYQRSMSTWLPIIQGAASSVQGMPNASFQDSLNR